MKALSLHLWSVSLLSALLAPLASAQAGWFDAFPTLPGWYDDDPPPVYVPRRPHRFVPAPRDGGMAVRTPDGEVIIVYPEDEYGERYAPGPDVVPDDVAPPPRPRPRNRIEALRPPAPVGAEPVVVPGIAPNSALPGIAPRPRLTRDAALTPVKPGGVKPADVRPAGARLADPARKPGQAPAALPKIVPAAQPKVAQARIALPVPRPNLESMDFAPATPAEPQAAPASPDRTALEDRR